jgi:DNA-binding CsgD family transcriptional regulator
LSEAVLEAEGSGVVLLGRAGAVLYQSSVAAEQIECFFGGSGRGLPDALEPWLERPGEPLVALRDGRRLVVTMVTGGVGGHVLRLDEEPGRAWRVPAPEALAALPLTPREREVLALAARGATNAEIADELVVSPRTVKKHLEQIYDELGVRGRTAAAAIAHAQLR